MKTKFIKLFLLLTLSALPVLAADDSISGTWNVNGSVYGNDINQVCTIKQDEKKLSGTCKSDANGEVNITGEVKDKVVTWQFNMDYNGTPLTIIFSGTLNDSTTNLTGKINVQPMNVEGEFTAKKADTKTNQ